jgi:hypothetical protein
MPRLETKPDLTPHTIEIGLGHDLLVILHREAALRDMSIDHFVAAMLDVIVADDLTRAVMDDQPPAPPPPPRRGPGRPRNPDGHSSPRRRGRSATEMAASAFSRRGLVPRIVRRRAATDRQ